MGNKIIYIGLLITLLSLCGCDKGQFLDYTGSLTTEIREAGMITRVIVYDNVNLIFTNRLDSGIIVSAGKNIINKISTEYRSKDNTLTVKNKNKFNWTRDLNPEISIYIPYNNIEFIRHESVGTISCEAAMSGDKFCMIIGYGNGKIELQLFYKEITVYNTSGGVTDVILKGACTKLYLDHTNYAPCDCRNLHAQIATVKETGIQNCFISVSERLEPTITNYGNIYYYGNPEIVNYTNTGKGKLIQCE